MKLNPRLTNVHTNFIANISVFSCDQRHWPLIRLQHLLLLTMSLLAVKGNYNNFFFFLFSPHSLTHYWQVKLSTVPKLKYLSIFNLFSDFIPRGNQFLESSLKVLKMYVLIFLKYIFFLFTSEHQQIACSDFFLLFLKFKWHV